MKTASDPRHQARILAFQYLFEYYFEDNFGENVDTSKITSIPELSEINEVSEYNQELYQSIIDGVKSSLKDIDAIISQFAPEWPIDQMSKTDLQILRIGVWEGFVGKVTPPKVAIDEAIEVAKEFGGEKSSKFVNGVLGAIIKNDNSSVEETPTEEPTNTNTDTISNENNESNQ